MHISYVEPSRALVFMAHDDQTISLTDRAACPRCGYDQRGVIATWADSCPLAGVCSECGLKFKWVDVLRADREGPQWCVEFVRRRRGIPLACFRTSCRILWPWHFWSRIELRHQLRPRRLAIFALWSLWPLLLCYVAAQTTVAVYVRYQKQQMFGLAAPVPTMIAQLQSQLAIYSNPKFFGSDGVADEQIRQQAIASIQQQIAALQANPPGVDLSYIAAILEAVFFPLASTSSGVVQIGTMSQPYTPPRELWDTAIKIRNWSGGGVGGGAMPFGSIAELVMLLPVPIISTWVVLGLIAACFVTLPVSMRRAKVRWSHLVRIVAYGTVIPCLALLVCLIVALWSLVSGGWTGLNEVLVMGTAAALPAILLVLWWWAAIRCYLRIPHAFLTALLLTIIAILVVPTIAVLVGLVVM